MRRNAYENVIDSVSENVKFFLITLTWRVHECLILKVY